MIQEHPPVPKESFIVLKFFRILRNKISILCTESHCYPH